tara:strand:+ start:2467 stop:3384 length:918 start_codon:yes stop_codon:yes gene_type:complete
MLQETNTDSLKSYFYWIQERHSIYKARVRGDEPPWTKDKILQDYRFTNPFRENDKTTIWMREHFTEPNRKRPYAEIFFNCCFFRMIGTSEFADDHGWVYFQNWDPEYTKSLIERRLQNKQRTFTGAYIITNQGLKLKKSEVVVDHFLKPIWENRLKLADVARETNSLEATHKELKQHRGWGGGGFMAYEVITDLNYTPVLRNAVDKRTWANAGPGAVRGLNRLRDRPLKKHLKPEQCNKEMHFLLQASEDYLTDEILNHIDMRTIEHSLCEWDKYQRVLLDQGRPRGKFVSSIAFKNKTFKGAVN